MNQRLVILAMVLISLSTFGFVAYRQLFPPPGHKLNVLVVSFCSFRMQMLSRYGGTDPSLLPAMEKFMNTSSYLLDNVYNSMAWTGIFTFTRTFIPARIFGEEGYNLFGRLEAGHLERLPWRRSYAHGRGPNDINDNDFEKDFDKDLEFARSEITNADHEPFFHILHFKYLHYPLIDRFHKDSGWDQFLSAEERANLTEYLAHPEKYPEKLPFLLLVSDDPNVALKHPDIVKQHWKTDKYSLMALTGLLTNEHYLQVWKNSPEYASDLAILEKIYAANIKYLDHVLEPVLNLWGNKELQNSTVVVMMADHGEMHMERDQLTHGKSLYDEALHVPVAIRFPGHWGGPKIVRDQLDFTRVANLLEGIVKGRVTAYNLQQQTEKLDHGPIVLRDCLNTLRGLRVANKYKYIVHIASDERSLFDLDADPGELHNLASNKPELVDKLEASFWENYPKFTGIDAYHCAPWVVGQEK